MKIVLKWKDQEDFYSNRLHVPRVGDHITCFGETLRVQRIVWDDYLMRATLYMTEEIENG